MTFAMPLAGPGTPPVTKTLAGLFVEANGGVPFVRTGSLFKKSRGRGIRNYDKRAFRLTNSTLSYRRVGRLVNQRAPCDEPETVYDLSQLESVYLTDETKFLLVFPGVTLKLRATSPNAAKGWVQDIQRVSRPSSPASRGTAGRSTSSPNSASSPLGRQHESMPGGDLGAGPSTQGGRVPMGTAWQQRQQQNGPVRPGTTIGGARPGTTMGGDRNAARDFDSKPKAVYGAVKPYARSRTTSLPVQRIAEVHDLEESDLDVGHEDCMPMPRPKNLRTIQVTNLASPSWRPRTPQRAATIHDLPSRWKGSPTGRTATEAVVGSIRGSFKRTLSRADSNRVLPSPPGSTPQGRAEVPW